MAREVPVSGHPLADPTHLLPESGGALLVAGQALATWVDVFALPLPPALSAGVTRDLDFLGDKHAAALHHKLLSSRYGKVELLIPKFGEITPNTAKILVYGDHDDIAAEIDYLGSLCGYQLEDEERLHRRAIPIEFPGFAAPVQIRVMHPFDCLKSRIHNLTTLTAKQNQQGLAQAKLAVDVVREHFREILRTDGANLRLLLFPLAEAIIELAASRDGVRSFHEFGVDVLTSIEPEKFPENFREVRWPQALRYVSRRRYGREGKKPVPPLKLTHD